MTHVTVRVDSADLDRLRQRLTTATMTELDRAASQIHRLNGPDVNAFGVFLAQILGIPSRIALGSVANHIDDLATDMAAVAARVKATADAYDQVEQDNVRLARGQVGF